jgi:hypothetical protein
MMPTFTLSSNVIFRAQVAYGRRHLPGHAQLEPESSGT